MLSEPVPSVLNMHSSVTHKQTMNECDDALSTVSLQRALGHSPSNTMQHQSESSSGPFSQHQSQPFAGSIYDTPPSMIMSPQYNSLFSPSSTSLVNISSNACCVCNNDCGKTPTVVTSCSHRYCERCSALTVGNGSRVCPMCSLRLDAPFTSLSPLTCSLTDKFTNLNTTLTSRLNGTADSMRIDPFTGIWGDQKHGGGKVNSLISSPPVFSSTPAHNRKPSCNACHDGETATHFCEQCSEMLCADCVDAHLRVRITRDHTVTSLHAIYKQNSNNCSPLRSCSLSTSEDGSAGRPASVCTIHDIPIVSLCETCAKTSLCTKCIPDHASHLIVPCGDLKTAIGCLVNDLRRDDKSLDDAVQSIEHMIERIDASVQATASELRSEIHRHISALEERKRELLQKVDTIRQSKLATLKGQTDTLTHRRALILQTLKLVEHSYDELDSAKLNLAYEQLLQLCHLPAISLTPNETDLIKFSITDSQIFNKIRTLGQLDSGPCTFTTKIVGESFKRAIRDRETVVSVQLRDACGEVLPSNDHARMLSATVKAPDGAFLQLHFQERDNGIISISYFPTQDGQHVLDVMLRGVSISGCPTTIEVRRGRNYGDIAQRGELFHFGKEGTGDGELCRPWGICCDLKNRIIVADRSNNRIQVFDLDGNFIMKFGTGGVRPGQFDRPAGVCVNTKNHIIVADKDNHRVQVFDELGNFVHKFGERGRAVGTFNYPWGVAVNNQNHIAVSDTRNHRVQIFNSLGQFLRKVGFDTAYFYKHLDSPRGLCFMPDGQLLITDFNNHRIVLLGSKSSPDMKCYGAEGAQEGCFLRPQGVKVDPEGHVLVCDSRNNRVQVFSVEDMRCVASFGGNLPALPTNNVAVHTVGSQPGIMPPGVSPNTSMTGSLLDTSFRSSDGVFSVPPPPFTVPPPSLALNTPSGGTTGSSGEGEAPAEPASLLDRPTDVCVSADGRIYVVDFGNNCVRVF